MPMYCGIGGVQKEIKNLYTGIGGVRKDITEMWAGNAGVKKQIFSSVKLLGDYSIGDIVKLNEGGNPFDYIVVHKGQPSPQYKNCDGVWLLRKDIVATNTYSYASTSYTGSFIHKFLCDPTDGFYRQYDTTVGEFALTPNVPCWNGSTVNNSYSIPMFILSGIELGVTDTTNFPNDGDVLSYFDPYDPEKVVANYGPDPYPYWTRSAYTKGQNRIWRVDPDGSMSYHYVMSDSGVRPALILSYETPVSSSGVVGA